jgi:hypothetical protein
MTDGLTMAVEAATARVARAENSMLEQLRSCELRGWRMKDEVPVPPAFMPSSSTTTREVGWLDAYSLRTRHAAQLTTPRAVREHRSWDGKLLTLLPSPGRLC